MITCSEGIDYTGDTRPTAEIDEYSNEYGPCPVPRPYRADISCTNWIDYAGDPRSNAEINSAGAQTGSCPLPTG